MRSEDNPKIVSERNFERLLTGQRLLLARAAHLRRRVVAWRCEDFHVSGRGRNRVSKPLGPALTETINQLQANKTGDMPTMQFFFEGIELSFIDTVSLATGHVHNNTCTGVGLQLDPREPPDDGKGPWRTLHYPPLAMIVRPDKVDLGHAVLGPEWPAGCIAVVPTTTSFTLQLPKGTILGPGEEAVRRVTIHRSGFALDNVYSVTDYWTQVGNPQASLWLLLLHNCLDCH